MEEWIPTVRSSAGECMYVGFKLSSIARLEVGGLGWVVGCWLSTIVCIDSIHPLCGVHMSVIECCFSLQFIAYYWHLRGFLVVD